MECRLLAKPAELLLLQERLDIPDLVYLAANVTVSRRDSVSVLVEGRLEARLSAGAVLSATELVRAEFDTVLLDNSAAIAKVGPLPLCCAVLCCASSVYSYQSNHIALIA